MLNNESAPRLTISAINRFPSNAQLQNPFGTWMLLSLQDFVAILNLANSLGSATGLACFIDIGRVVSQVLGLGDKHRTRSLLP